jgi:hypothetical protein
VRFTSWRARREIARDWPRGPARNQFRAFVQINLIRPN